MKPSRALSLAILCILAVILSARDLREIKDVQLPTVEEREPVTREMMEAYLKEKDDLVGPVSELVLASAGAAITLSSVDYTQSGGQVALQVANAVVPIIGAALALVPGVGPLVSGLFMGVWGLVSPLFAPKKDNPMEKMLNELAKNMEVKMDEKLSSIVNRAIYGEITRNNYICTKYNFVFQFFAQQLNSSKKLSTQDALKLTGYLNDCDNFLKDTAEAFVYDEYAHVLWIPSAITTSVRVSFLTEVIKYGHLMGIDRNVTAMYFRELQSDIQRQFKLHLSGIEKLHNDSTAKKETHGFGKDFLKDRYTEKYAVEEAACQMQSQLFYFDRELYPYGMPEVLNTTDLYSEIKMADHYKPARDGTVKHLQMFFDVYRTTFPGALPPGNSRWYETLKIMNCLMGPILYPRFPSAFGFKFYPMPSNQKYSYEFRVMYFHSHEYYRYKPDYPVPVLIAEKKSGSKEYKDFVETHKTLNMGEPKNNDINLQIKFVKPNDRLARESKKIIDIPFEARWQNCPYNHDRGTEELVCKHGIRFFKGMFRMYSAGTYNVDSYSNINNLFRVGNPSLPFQGLSEAIEIGFLVGVEIILRPRI